MPSPQRHVGTSVLKLELLTNVRKKDFWEKPILNHNGLAETEPCFLTPGRVGEQRRSLSKGSFSTSPRRTGVWSAQCVAPCRALAPCLVHRSNGQGSDPHTGEGSTWGSSASRAGRTWGGGPRRLCHPTPQLFFGQPTAPSRCLSSHEPFRRELGFPRGGLHHSSLEETPLPGTPICEGWWH